MDEEDRELFERGKRLAIEWSDIAMKNGYSLAEIVVAADAIRESVARFALIKKLFGDESEAVFELLTSIEVEKTIKEAEDAINGD